MHHTPVNTPIVVEMAESFDDFATPQSLNRCDRS
ncbi:hypothetical protein Gpo141_00011737, partial [Globisporangium polare]